MLIDVTIYESDLRQHYAYFKMNVFFLTHNLYCCCCCCCCFENRAL